MRLLFALALFVATSALGQYPTKPIRVLVLEGKPYWDAKFLLRTLGSDPAVALDSVVKVSDTRYMRRTLSRYPRSHRRWWQRFGSLRSCYPSSRSH